ncbi:Crp/Fnr family transcriptional regulator [Solibacillus sp. FSL H8-0538]|uniref:Crp/Fnr family transcriptional regulator n=1 Tax=Solibacillus sp. FSL H8-0538 TaxID=2921400 RepID=UPI0030FA6F71
MRKISDEGLRAAYIKQFNLPALLPIDVLNMPLYEFNQEEILCQQGEPLHYVFLLVKGKVRIYSTSSEGKRLIVAFNAPLELFGDIELVQNMDLLNTVEAVGTVHAFALSIPLLRQRMQENIGLLQYLLNVVTRKFCTKSTTLSFHLLNEVDVRFASYLLSITHDEYRRMQTDTIAKSELKEIAEFIGTSTRHQNRIINDFIDKGIIGRVKNGIVIKDTTTLMKKAQGNIYEMQ